MFLNPDYDFIQKFGSQLVNYNNANYSSQVIRYCNKHWIVKFNDNTELRKREILVSLLGSGLVNITETKFLNQDEISAIQTIIRNSLIPEASFLTRVVQDYSEDEIPLKTLESAVAGELVFSVWIRRRDTHEFNRAYVKYIPLFFDHGVAFEGEQDISTFFSHFGKGFAGSWRVKIIRSVQEIDTLFRKENWGDNHFIIDKNLFITEVNKIKQLIKLKSVQLDLLGLDRIISEDKKKQIIEMLKKNTETLDNDVAKMLEVVLMIN